VIISIKDGAVAIQGWRLFNKKIKNKEEQLLGGGRVEGIVGVSRKRRPQLVKDS
jgi:hypothetical protein